MNLTNPLSVQTPELVLLRHTSTQTDNIGERISGGAANKIANQDGIWEPKLSDIATAATHGKIEMISEKLAYRKFIENSEFETRKSIRAGKYRGARKIKNIET